MRQLRGFRARLRARAHAFLALAVLLASPGLFSSAYAQVPGSDELSKAAPKAFNRIQKSMQKYEQVGEQIGQKAAEFISQNGETDDHTIGQYTYKGPKKHPFLKDDGHDSDGKAGEEYVADSKAALNEKTFPGCFEERRVHDGTYTGMCMDNPGANCPRFILMSSALAGQCTECLPGSSPDCVEQDRYVSEHYFPIYQVRVFPGRAMGSFSVVGSYLSGSDKRPELGLKQTKQRVDNELKDLVKQVMQKLGLPQPDGEDFGPEEYTPAVEWYGTDGQQSADGSPYSFHSLTYQTNVHRVATRSRQPDAIKRMGYDLVPHCFWQTLDNPAKEVISNASYGPKEYLLASMWAKETEQIKPDGKEAAKQTIISPGQTDMFQITENLKPSGNNLPQQFQGLAPSLRSQEWSEWMQDLKKVGVQPQSLSPRDYVFYGLTLAPFNAAHYNAFHDPVYAAIGHGISHYYLTGLPQSDLSPNFELRRALWLTRYTARQGKGRQGYSGEDPYLRDPIVFTDKFNLVFPPLEDGDPRKPTHCIRPENVARVEPPEKEGDAMARSLEGGWFNIPLTLRTRFPQYGIQKLNYAQEVRLVFWEKRVACFCQFCGRIKGCLNLNDGDLKEDNFYGKEPFSGGGTARMRELLGLAATDSRPEPASSDWQPARSPAARRPAASAPKAPQEGGSDGLERLDEAPAPAAISEPQPARPRPGMPLDNSFLKGARQKAPSAEAAPSAEEQPGQRQEASTSRFRRFFKPRQTQTPEIGSARF